MFYATILVLLDPSRRPHHRLEIAAQLAVKNNAALIGMLACPRPDPAWVHCLPDGASYLDSIRVA
ncbi:hypothetical protein [Cupriavidus basilensis]|uniref:hypothetical protein n=1 Tax=Cupriavidus basilensis TaxID=68895 RepID=UPI0039F6D25B